MYAVIIAKVPPFDKENDPFPSLNRQAWNADLRYN
jgi:hypothetical protein